MGQTSGESFPEDEPALRAVNDAFYAALESKDLESMEHIWHHASWVGCIHPGSDLYRGWDAVRASWAEIFAQPGWMRVIPTAVEVSVADDTAMVVCAENITTGDHGDVSVSSALATNIYQKIHLRWRMVHHHASSAPMRVTQPFSGIVQ
jgi:uncharacterized protein (TIGR02246 family)